MIRRWRDFTESCSCCLMTLSAVTARGATFLDFALILAALSAPFSTKTMTQVVSVLANSDLDDFEPSGDHGAFGHIHGRWTLAMTSPAVS
jgi:hypothetical protein